MPLVALGLAALAASVGYMYHAEIGKGVAKVRRLLTPKK